MRIVLRYLLLIVVVSTLSTSVYSQSRDVMVVVSSSQAIYERAYNDLNQELLTIPSDQLKSRVLFIDKAPSGPMPAAPDFIVSIGSQAMRFVLQYYPNTPRLHTFITQSNYRKNQQRTLSDYPPVARGVIFLDQPLQRQIDLAQSLDVDARVGILLSTSAKGWMNEWLLEQSSLSDKLIVEYAQDEDDVVAKAKKLLAKADILLAVPDDVIWKPTSARWLLFLAYQQRKPVVGFSAALTRAGAVASVYSESEQIGLQTKEVIYQWLKGVADWRQAASPKYFRYAFNETIANSLKIDTSVLQMLKTKDRQK